MVVISCDNCQRQKLTNEEWILGFSVESSSIPETKRTMIFDVGGLELLRAQEQVQKTNVQPSSRSLLVNQRWDNRRILQEGAVHLCSPKCEAEYIQKLATGEAA